MPLRKCLPIENYTLQTSLTAQEVFQRLYDKIEEKRNSGFNWRSKISNKPYEGKVSTTSFTMNRIIDYRNSFLPVIRGKIISLAGQTRVEINMRPAAGPLIFMSIWLGFVGVICISLLTVAVIHFNEVFKNGVNGATVIPFAMLLFGILLQKFAFRSESKEAKRFLATLLKAEETNM